MIRNIVMAAAGGSGGGGAKTSFLNGPASSNTQVSVDGLTVTRITANGHGGVRMFNKLPSSGKYYFECTQDNIACHIGVATTYTPTTGVVPAPTYGHMFERALGPLGVAVLSGFTSNPTYGFTSSSITSSTGVTMMAIDMDNKRLYLGIEDIGGNFRYRNNTTSDFDPAVNPEYYHYSWSFSDDLYVAVNMFYLGTSAVFNFGQSAYLRSPPAGYSSLPDLTV